MASKLSQHIHSNHGPQAIVASTNATSLANTICIPSDMMGVSRQPSFVDSKDVILPTTLDSNLVLSQKATKDELQSVKIGAVGYLAVTGSNYGQTSCLKKCSVLDLKKDMVILLDEDTYSPFKVDKKTLEENFTKSDKKWNAYKAYTMMKFIESNYLKNSSFADFVQLVEESEKTFPEMFI